MATVNIHAAKTHFSSLVEAAERGEETVIARDGRPVAKLVPLAPVPRKKLVLGALAGIAKIPEDFDAPLPDDLLDAFEGR